jgi:hypothetical protein
MIHDIVCMLIGVYGGMCLYVPLNDLLRAWRR